MVDEAFCAVLLLKTFLSTASCLFRHKDVFCEQPLKLHKMLLHVKSLAELRKMSTKCDDENDEVTLMQ